jgi:DNA (cytosine-5)-methyltransferase 1
MRAIDFFCGAGGLTRGLLSAGIDVVAGFDANSLCKESYERNNRSTLFYESDICDVSVSTVWKLLGSRRTADLLIAGCAPCQPFSKQRKRPASSLLNGSDAADRDATLLGAFARLVEAIQPGQVLIENVPGIAKVKGLSTYRRFLRMLRLNSYDIAEGVLDAKYYGVPQTRRRYVVIAVRRRNASLPAREYGTSLRPITTVRKAIEHFPPITAGESHPLIPNHVAAGVSAKNLARIRSTPHNGGDRRSWPRDLILECHRGDYEGHTDVYGRMSWDLPAPTLTGRCNSLSNGRYGHPSQDRAISLREAASLQSFPDSYIFYGLNQQIARQIGNAVPVKFAEALGRHLQTLRSSGATGRNR